MPTDRSLCRSCPKYLQGTKDPGFNTEVWGNSTQPRQRHPLLSPMGLIGREKRTRTQEKVPGSMQSPAVSGRSRRCARGAADPLHHIPGTWGSLRGTQHHSHGVMGEKQGHQARGLAHALRELSIHLPKGHFRDAGLHWLPAPSSSPGRGFRRLSLPISATVLHSTCLP